jgi:hypothetical protein
MSCCGSNKKPNSPEYGKEFKVENNGGCGCGGSNRNSCDTLSLARVGSPLWKWEQKYGKLITKITVDLDETGRFVQKIVKKPCPLPEKKLRTERCYSLRYKVAR